MISVFRNLPAGLPLKGRKYWLCRVNGQSPARNTGATLLRARAIENQLFVVAANCCGVVGKLDFFGMSMIIDPKGELLAEAGYEPENITAMLDFTAMTAWREQIPCFNDRKPECY